MGANSFRHSFVLKVISALVAPTYIKMGKTINANNKLALAA